MSSFGKFFKSISNVQKKFPKVDIISYFLPECDLFMKYVRISIKSLEKPRSGEKMSSFGKFLNRFLTSGKKFPKLDIFFARTRSFHEIDQIFDQNLGFFPHFGSQTPAPGHSPSYPIKGFTCKPYVEGPKS